VYAPSDDRERLPGVSPRAPFTWALDSGLPPAGLVLSPSTGILSGLPQAPGAYSFVIRVTDDGKGIPPHRVQNVTSHGLASMRHRIAALGGSWDVRSPGGRGTMVTALIPLPRMLEIA
jgi:signal transduction histidine kinase